MTSSHLSFLPQVRSRRQLYILHSLHQEIPPTVIHLTETEYLSEMVVRIKPGEVFNSIKWIETKWKEFMPDTPIEYSFLDEKLDSLYKAEINFSKLINCSTIFATFLVCLGLFGLTMFITEQRTKEIGIRKVLGASVSNIVKLVSKEFILLALAAFVIATPIAYYFINQWMLVSFNIFV